MKLSEFKKDQRGVIKEILESKISSRLFEYGILPGSNFMVLSIAPFDGPIFIKVDNLRIALRRKEAAAIIVE